jgi:hypothetical protein
LAARNTRRKASLRGERPGNKKQLAALFGLDVFHESSSFVAVIVIRLAQSVR